MRRFLVATCLAIGLTLVLVGPAQASVGHLRVVQDPKAAVEITYGFWTSGSNYWITADPFKFKVHYIQPHVTVTQVIWTAEGNGNIKGGGYLHPSDRKTKSLFEGDLLPDTYASWRPWPAPFAIQLRTQNFNYWMTKATVYLVKTTSTGRTSWHFDTGSCVVWANYPGP